MRRCNGICPPSNPRRRELPRRDFCPLLPEPAVLPSLEPMPRPTRTFFLREPAGGCKFASVKKRRPFEAGFAGLCWPRFPLPRGPPDVFFVIGAADETDHPLDLHLTAGLLAVVLSPVVRLGRAFFGRHFLDCH